MAVGPNDYWGELNPPDDDREDWELPDYVEEWNEWWFSITTDVPTYRFATRYWDDNRFAVAA